MHALHLQMSNMPKQWSLAIATGSPQSGKVVRSGRKATSIRTQACLMPLPAPQQKVVHVVSRRCVLPCFNAKGGHSQAGADLQQLSVLL